MLPPIIKSHNANAIFGPRQLRRSTGLPGIAGDQPHSISNKEPTATPSFYLCFPFPRFSLFNAHCLLSLFLSLLDQLTQKKLLKKRAKAKAKAKHKESSYLPFVRISLIFFTVFPYPWLDLYCFFPFIGAILLHFFFSFNEYRDTVVGFIYLLVN